MTRTRDLANLIAVQDNKVVATTTTNFSTSSGSYQNTNFSVTINKRFANSKIYLTGSLSIGVYVASATTNGLVSARFFETNSSRQFDLKNVQRNYGVSGGVANIANISALWLDTEAGTGSRTYRIDIALQSGTSAELNGFNTSDFKSVLIAEEII
jgi:hypothetical protein